MNLNAGQRLLLAQKQQGTGLCVGIDMHYAPAGPFDDAFYAWNFGDLNLGYNDVIEKLMIALTAMPGLRRAIRDEQRTIKFVRGMVNYFLGVVDTAWGEGIRVYKPQVATFEQLSWFEQMALAAICSRMNERRTLTPGALHFRKLDAKRNDIGSTQAYYYRAYLSGPDDEVIPGLGGLFDFDTMTVTTWMGEDVLTPGLEFFRAGKGAAVVTRTSNPSGTTLQDMEVLPNEWVELKPDQRKFSLMKEQNDELRDLLGRGPTAHEVVLYLTEQFSRDNGLDQEGVSPIFSVMGATVKFDESFRKIRPGGIPLIPAFGAQQGEFSNILPLMIREGPFAGHIGVLNNSRATNFAWVAKWGGSGDPKNWREDLARAIAKFRKDEKEAYAGGADYPF